MDLDPNLISNIKDPRIHSLLHGVGSVQLLSRTLHQPDWLVAADDKLTAIPQYQYATLIPAQVHTVSDVELDAIVYNNQLYTNISDQDKAQLDRIKKALDTCPVCKRGHYRKLVYDILYKYTGKHELNSDIASDYPEVKVQLTPVFTDATKPYVERYPRHACYDCIQKHVGQAYITAMQARMGYAQHIMLCYGHLAQAIQECPKDAIQLKALLTLCLGVSKLTRQGFVPLHLIYPAIKEARSADQGSVATVQNQQDSGYSLEHNITAELIHELTDKDLDLLYSGINLFCTYCDALRLESQQLQRQALRVRWIGVLGNIAQIIAAYSLSSANAIRNIRLMFYAAPELIVQVPQYNMLDVRALLEQQQMSRAVSKEPGTTA